jgi:antiviral helicase SLH1
MLVCAPTGAGKTDVAVLTVLRALSMYADIRLPDGRMRNKDFKIVYVAPMKALASEIVKKMRKRFEWCGLAVRELTGDMQLTRKEIAETQMIVTTPEKWDVVTRKTTGEGELASVSLPVQQTEIAYADGILLSCYAFLSSTRFICFMKTEELC